jgi:hypothetical protein
MSSEPIEERETVTDDMKLNTIGSEDIDEYD